MEQNQGKGLDMKPSFHDDATIFGYIGDELFCGPIQKLYDWNDKNGPASEIFVNLKVLKLYNQSLQFVWFQKIGQGLILPIFLHF